MRFKNVLPILVFDVLVLLAGWQARLQLDALTLSAVMILPMVASVIVSRVTQAPRATATVAIGTMVYLAFCIALNLLISGADSLAAIERNSGSSRLRV